MSGSRMRSNSAVSLAAVWFYCVLDGEAGTMKQNSNVPAFLSKLWTLVEDSDTNEFITWSQVTAPSCVLIGTASILWQRPRCRHDASYYQPCVHGLTLPASILVLASSFIQGSRGSLNSFQSYLVIVTHVWLGGHVK